MSSLRGFKKKLSGVARLWREKNYDEAIGAVETLMQRWPGNAHLTILWATLVQLQDNPTNGLDDAKQALQNAVELDKGSPTALIELAHFLDNVEDDLQTAAKVYGEGVAVARELLLDGLIGQAKVFRQLDKKEDFLRCIVEIFHLTRFEAIPKRTRAEEPDLEMMVESPKGHVHFVQLKGPRAAEIQELLREWIQSRSA